MNKEMSVQITGTHFTDGEKTTVTTKSTGQLFEKNGKLYLKYSETDADTGATRNALVKVFGKTVSVEYKGNTDTLMLFEVGQTKKTTYITPLGSMPLEIRTHALEVDSANDLLHIKIDYEMSLSDGPFEKAEIVIDAK